MKLGDLGLAKILGAQAASATQTGTAMGTPYYVSPEQACGNREIDFRADIYSLGCTLFHMLTGATPYQGDSAMGVMIQHITQPPPDIAQVWPQCPQAIAGLLEKMLRKDAGTRHQSYEELLEELIWVSAKLEEEPEAAASPAISMIVPMPKATATAPGPMVRPMTVAPETKGRGLRYAAVAGVVVLLAIGALLWAPWKKPPVRMGAAAIPATPIPAMVEKPPAPPVVEERPEKSELAKADSNATPVPVASAAPATEKTEEFKPQFNDAVSQPPATRPANGPRVLLVGGGSAHDFVKFFGAADKDTLTPAVGWVDFTQNLNGIAPILKNIDVLVLSANQPISAETRKALIDYANAGGGIVALHPGTWYTWNNFPQYYKEIVGGGTRRHDNFGPYFVTLTAPTNPITNGVPATFEITDELFYYIADPAATPVEVLATATSPNSGKAFPQVWIVKHPKAKIVGLTLGHDAKAHDLPAYQTLLKNAVLWVGGASPPPGTDATPQAIVVAAALPGDVKEPALRMSPRIAEKPPLATTAAAAAFKPSASHTGVKDTVTALNDGKEPSSSADESIPQVSLGIRILAPSSGSSTTSHSRGSSKAARYIGIRMRPT